MAPLLTCFWFTIVGGTGISLEITQPGIISKPFEGFNLPAALLATTQALPWGTLLSGLFLVLTTIFVATTGDSMSYSIAMVGAGHDEPNPWIRVFWGGAMALMAAILLYMGAGQIGVLQQFIVLTAIPVSLVILPSLWTGPKAAMAMAREQGLV